ncbi:MAG: tRNA threonylcarbamoyladenosine dehydratase [Oscillospiraceae bacterium]
MDERFKRSIMYYGEEVAARLRKAHVAVVGLGGVGSYAAEALARSGLGALTLVDHDEVSLTNINRQICALSSTLGRSKAEVMAERARDIDPELVVTAKRLYYSADTHEAFFEERYDYIVDAIDLVSCKTELIASAMERNIPIISALGTGNKKDASLFRVTDITLTQNCPFARVMRRELRRRGIEHHLVVYSPEKAIKPVIYDEPPPGRRSVPASLPWVPASAGLLLAGEVVKSLAGI